MTKKILLAGDGGQGIQVIADTIVKAAAACGLQASTIPNYGLEQRGGVSLAFVKFSDTKISYPKFTKPDILLILSDQASERVKDFLPEAERVLNVSEFKEELSNIGVVPTSFNIFFLGKIAAIIGQENPCIKDNILSFLKERLAKKPNWEENEKAFNLGILS